jgi:Asp/Glu/hydantoin racemase
MNEQIKELLKQAGVGDNWNKADWYSMSPEMIEKFAELIVLGCAGVGYDASYYECALNVSNKIKQHFGVEK